MNVFVVPIVAIVSTFLFLGYLVKGIVDAKSIKEKSRINEKMLDKISNMKQVNDFLNTEMGREYLKSMKFQTIGSREKIIGGFYRAIVVLFSGLGFIVVNTSTSYSEEYFDVFGILVLFLGAGMLIGSIASIVMAKKWHLLNGED